MNLKSYVIETEYKYGKMVFLTKAKSGKDALQKLINNSCDFNNILNDNDSNNMLIKVKRV